MPFTFATNAGNEVNSEMHKTTEKLQIKFYANGKTPEKPSETGCRWFDPPPRVRCLVPAPAGLYHRAVPPGFLPPTTTIKSPPTRVRGRLAPTGL
ncbi:hypothetical protein CapIbe_022617 [Capra ibex]